MKIALLGKGKTGGKVVELAKISGHDFTIFDTHHTPSIENLPGHDVIISFLPGDAFKKYIPLLITSRIPVVCGSTGLTWPSDLDQELKEKKISWIFATNFSLGMNLVHQMILILGRAQTLFSKYQFSLSEIHHTQKLDSPSGTALSWANWLNHEVDIVSERKGDVIGIHELKLSTPFEEITLKHDALDRKIFAEGALFAAHKMVKDRSIEPGLHLFQDIVQKELLHTLKP